jgi:hypothetical protein
VVKKPHWCARSEKALIERESARRLSGNRYADPELKLITDVQDRADPGRYIGLD